MYITYMYMYIIHTHVHVHVHTYVYIRTWPNLLGLYLVVIVNFLAFNTKNCESERAHSADQEEQAEGECVPLN